MPLTSLARQIYLSKRTRRAGGRRFRVGPKGRQHCGIGWPGIASGVLFGAAAHVALLLVIRLNLRSAPPAAAFAVVGLAPLIANVLYDRSRRARPLRPQRQKT